MTTASSPFKRDVYKDSELAKILTDRRLRLDEDPVALFTDIDKTFYRVDKAGAAREITLTAQQEHWPIIAITGNPYPILLERILSGELPYFHVIAGAVGTEIWFLHAESERRWYIQDKNFENRLLQTGFIRSQLLPVAHTMVERFHQQHPDWNFSFQDPAQEAKMLTHPDPLYQPFKISFNFTSPSTEESLAAVLQSIKEFFPNHPIVICEDSSPSQLSVKHYCADIVAGTKSGALAYIQSMFGIKKGIVAGDSGNDVDMLLNSNTLTAVIVGGHELRARSAIEKAQFSERRWLGIFKRPSAKRVHIDTGEHRQAGESILHLLRSFNKKSIWQRLSNTFSSAWRKRSSMYDKS